MRVNVLQSWPRQFMKKWLTFRATGDEFKCEDDIRCGHDAEDNSNSDEFEEDYGNFTLSCLKSFLTSQQHFFDLCLYDCPSRKHFAIDSSVPIAQSAMQLQLVKLGTQAHLQNWTQTQMMPCQVQVGTHFDNLASHFRCHEGSNYLGCESGIQFP